MPTVQFTSALKRFFPGLQATEATGTTIAEVVENIEKVYPGLKNYILDDQGAVRQHVNIYVDKELIKDRKTLSDIVEANQEVFVLQALSGG